MNRRYRKKLFQQCKTKFLLLLVACYNAKKKNEKRKKLNFFFSSGELQFHYFLRINASRYVQKYSQKLKVVGSDYEKLETTTSKDTKNRQREKERSMKKYSVAKTFIQHVPTNEKFGTKFR